MALTSRERRALAAKGNRLKADITIRGGELSDATIAHVRNALSKRELIKVRISTDDREECARAADQLAERVPCDLVQRVGRVALLFRAGETSAGD
jgi:RNA-binding protein